MDEQVFDRYFERYSSFFCDVFKMKENPSNPNTRFNSLNQAKLSEGQEIIHERKYEDIINLNATSIIQGLWDSINDEIDAA